MFSLSFYQQCKLSILYMPELLCVEGKCLKKNRWCPYSCGTYTEHWNKQIYKWAKMYKVAKGAMMK